MHLQIARHRAEIAEICRRYRLRRLDIFGSTARSDDFDPAHSDIDLLSEFDELDKPRTLADYFALRDALASVTGHPVDLVMAGTVRNPYIRAEIESAPEKPSMRRDPLAYLWDARESLDAISQFIAAKQLHDYLTDAMLRAAVEHNMEIIGEALNQLSKVSPELAAQIPELSQAIELRNILIHGYTITDDEIVGALHKPVCLPCTTRLMSYSNNRVSCKWLSWKPWSIPDESFVCS